MHVRVRIANKPDTVVPVPSKLTKIEQLRDIIRQSLDIETKFQLLFYGGKLLENGYTLFDYNIKLNDVIQMIIRQQQVENTCSDNEVQEDVKPTEKTISTEIKTDEDKYEDTVSPIYEVGDLIDVKDIQQGYWSEGKIVRIVHQPKNDQNNGTSQDENVSQQILYKVQLDEETVDSQQFCKLNDIRPRAREAITINDVEVGQIVMININLDEPDEKGYWYDFKIDKIINGKKQCEVIGTVYLGTDIVQQDNFKVKIHDKIFLIEEPVPLLKRTKQYKMKMSKVPEKRSSPIRCDTCLDKKDILCRECGCYICSKKDHPENILLCDECDYGFHLNCLTPPLTEIPDDDWYCPSCKRDPNDVVAPGATKQLKKSDVANSSRDWGRGMACAGKTKDCDMPVDHFGPIPGIDVGMMWRYRIQLSEVGLHRPSISGIHGRESIGAFSLILAGGYEDDEDHGDTFIYTGSGGRDLSGNKRTAAQSCDQLFERENRALARNCAVKEVSPKGAKATKNWREGKPVRVIRSYKMRKHFPKYAPPGKGYRYDGIYKVFEYYPEQGLSGFRVYKYVLKRDDPSPAPWEANAKKFEMIYPEGYLEAEALRQAMKQKKKINNQKKNQEASNLSDLNSSDDSNEFIEPPKKRMKKATLVPLTETLNDETGTTKKKLGRPKKNLAITSKNSETHGQNSKVTKDKEIKDKETKDKETKDKEIKDKETKHKETKDKDSTDREIKDKETKDKDSTDKEIEDKETKDKETKGKQTKGKQTKGKKTNGRGPKQTTLDALCCSRQRNSDLSSTIRGGPDDTSSDTSNNSDTQSNKENTLLSAMEQKEIKADRKNTKLWDECLEVLKNSTKKEFLDHITQAFRCAICQKLAVSPVTTPCSHNFCMSCIMRVFTASDSKSCPTCRQDLPKQPIVNVKLEAALQTLLPGYDTKKKRN